MKKGLIIGISYAVVHFTVEVASFYLMFSRLEAAEMWWLAALAFDALAFVPQSFFGILTDRYPKLNIGIIGLVMIAAALLMPWDAAALVLVATGNAMVHIDGAQHTLRGNDGKITPDAVFVGAGSFGVITGQLLAQYKVAYALYLTLMLLVLSGIIVLSVHKKNNLVGKSAELDITSDVSMPVIVLCAFIAVTARGYIAYAIPIEWKKTMLQSVILFVFMGVGKIMGGVLSDLIGYRKVIFISLAAGLPFLLFGNTCMLLSLTGVALFSMTMPVTIAILSSEFPRQPGFAFGITTLGLFCGTAPAFFIRPETLQQHQVAVVVLTLVTLLSLNICIKRKD